MRRREREKRKDSECNKYHLSNSYATIIIMCCYNSHTMNTIKRYTSSADTCSNPTMEHTHTPHRLAPCVSLWGGKQSKTCLQVQWDREHLHNV